MTQAQNNLIIAPHLRTPLDESLLDAAHWQDAIPVSIDRYWSGELAPPKRHSSAQIVWNSEALVIRFICRQDEVLIVNEQPDLSQKTVGLWDRDVCELFLAPNKDNPTRYFEFEVAPTGEWIDLAIEVGENGRTTDWEFASGLTSEQLIKENQVLIAMRIPWSERIPQPARGDEWRCNLFRCVGSGPQRGYLCWQPTLTERPNFHVPSAFGTLRLD